MFLPRCFLLSVAILFLTQSAQAQNCADQYWGTKTLYQPQQKKYTPVPAGYLAVFINHVGRHGSRHLTKDVAGTLAYNMLQKADSAKGLTPDDTTLKNMVMLLQKIEKPGLKSISIRGAEEQQGIGHRIMQNYAHVFGGKQCLHIAITKEERTKQSSEAFLKGLNYQPACKPEVVINNDDLRFFSIAPAYAEFENNGASKTEYNKLEAAIKPANFNRRFLSRFFEPDFTDKLSADEQSQMIDDVAGFSAITNSIQQEIVNAGHKPADLDFRKLITCSQLQVLDELNSADDFLKKGPAMNNSGIQVRDAVPLLVSFINTTDAYVAKQNLAANLRFAHAETIAPIAALMDIKGADKPANDILTYNKVWSAAAVIPLSSNIQWVLYKNAKGNYIVKILLNEKEVAIDGLTTKTFPYYQWNDIRKHYMAKLNTLQVKLTDDMHAYLMNLK
jgi:multiple inositol-polyphosphate phosphatase/2,3-bisphosphoglycerate 3-phosphatase